LMHILANGNKAAAAFQPDKKTLSSLGGGLSPPALFQGLQL
jgi:hypothetical protein